MADCWSVHPDVPDHRRRGHVARRSLVRDHEPPAADARKPKGSAPGISDAQEAHDTAHRVLQEHMDDLHKISQILIERETIDKEQFERLLAGEPEESVFPDEAPSAEPERAPADEKKRRPEPKPRPFPLPGATMQPPPKPEGAGS